MITVVVGKRWNTTPWFSAVGEKTARTATANCTNRNRKLHEPQPQIARTATANHTNRNRKLHEPRPQTTRTATANCTNRDRKPHEPCRKPHEPRPNRRNLFLGSTVYCYSNEFHSHLPFSLRTGVYRRPPRKINAFRHTLYFEKRPFESSSPVRNSKSQNSAQNINDLTRNTGFRFILEMSKYIQESSCLSK